METPSTSYYDHQLTDSSANILDIATLKQIYESVKYKNTTDYRDDHLISCLKQTALEDENCESIEELLQRKRYAFECLRLISSNLSDQFFFMFYDNLIMNLQLVQPGLLGSPGSEQLNDYLTKSSTLSDTKILTLQTLLVSASEGYINFALFKQFPIHEWRRKLLIYVLLQQHNVLEISTMERITMIISELDDLVHNNSVSWTIEDLLEILVTHQTDMNLNIHFITDMFHVISIYPIIFHMLPHNVTAIRDKIYEVKMSELLGRCRNTEFLTVNYPEILIYIVNLPLNIMIAFSTKIDKNIQGVITFVKMLLSYSNDIDQTDFLLRMNFNDSTETLKYEFCFQVVKNELIIFFPRYSIFTYNDHILHDKVSRDISIKCTCFKEKCLLHHTAKCNKFLFALNTTMAKILCSLNEPSDISLETISAIFSVIVSSEKISEMINALEILIEYNLEFTDEQLRMLFLEQSNSNFERHIHKLVIAHSFVGTYEKSVDQLIEELESTNSGITTSIIELFLKVKNIYEKKSILFPNENSINFWNINLIEQWSLLMRVTAVSNEEKLAVLKRAAELTVKLHLRDIQLLAIIIIIKCNKGNGRLCQVNTGEGKTLIIAMVAAFHVFSGHQVDVYTSSSVLAIPQSEEFKKFYSIFNITVTNNIAQNANYKCDIIYGTNHSFQRDVLHDEFMKYETRYGRNFDVVIVDEVDNMFVDGNNWLLKLSRNMPGMEYLEILLGAVYIQVNTIAGSLIERNGQVYYRDEEEVVDEDGNAKAEVKYREIPLECSKSDFIIQCTESHIRKLIRDRGVNEKIDANYPEIKIPNHLRDVICHVQVRKWIINAIESIFNYVKEEDYVLEDGKIVIVDADNTGVLKRSSHWCNGLHQFLQIKHGAKIEPESFTSNFISNVALFTRYTSIYGLTGTLGNKDTREFLHKTYNVDSAIIPPFKYKQHKYLKPIILYNKGDWLLEIANNSINKLRNSRAVLIIMKYIRETEELAKVFKDDFGYDKSKVKLYTTDRNIAVIEEPLNPGDVVITTNIAGRGADIKLKQEIDKCGGLHVCLTFLPMNARVEEQNIGRTSRKGNRGTSQLILCVPKMDEIKVDDLKSVRTENEKKVIANALDVVKRTKLKDKIFQNFCKLLDVIVVNTEDTDVKVTKRKALEERFGIWLQMYENKFDDDNFDALKQFDSFKEIILSDNSKCQLIKNPYMYVTLGNKYLENKQFLKAILVYTKAINLDHNFSENAYYNRAWAYLKMYGNNLSNNKKYIDDAIKDLKTARKLIQDKEYGLHLLQTASKNNIFSEQIIHKLNLYNIQKNVIEMAIGPDTEEIEEQLKKMNAMKAQSNNLTAEENSKISEMVSKLESDRNNTGVIGRAKNNKRDIKVEPLPKDFIPVSDESSHEEEIIEFKRNGWLPGFQITEIKPIDWKSVIGLLGIGLGQLIIGAALTVFTLGAGANIGLGLISEGVSDIITAVKDGLINRNFDWATWALMKVISIAVSIVCAGFKAIKDVARTAYAGAKNVVTTGAKAFSQVAKEGWKIAAKKIGFELAKGVGKTIATDLINYGIDKTLVPMLEEAIVEIVREPIEKALTNNSKVMHMLKLDETKANTYYENQIRTIGQKLLSPKNNSKLGLLAAHTAKCITGNLGFGNIHQIISILTSSSEFLTFTSNFVLDLNRAIAKIEIDDKHDQNVDSSALQYNSKQVDHQTLDSFEGTSNNDGNDDIDLNKLNQPIEQVKQEQIITIKCTPSDLSNEFAGMVSTSMVSIMSKNVISPIVHMGVNYSVEELSSAVNKSLVNETETFRAGKRILDDGNRACKNKLTTEESSQLSNQDIEEVNKLIRDTEVGGPISLVHLGPLSKAANSQIEVYDQNGKLMFPVGDNKNSNIVKMQYHPPENDCNVGHFTLLGKQEPLTTGSGNNMCAFNCIAQLSNKDPNQLKKDTLDNMRNNKHTLAARLGDIKMLQMSRNSVLSIKGGAEYYGKNYKDALQYISSSAGRRGFGNINPGHPDVHVSYKGDPKIKFAAMSNEINCKIIVVDKKGNELYTTGSQYGGDPIIFQYNVDKKDPANNYFSEPGNSQNRTFKHDDDVNFYKYMGNKFGKDVIKLKTATENGINKIIIPSTESCIENKSKTVPPPPKGKPQTGFLNKDDEAFVLDLALKTPAVKNRLAQLNKYKPGVRQNKNYTKIPVTIPANDLNLPRTVTAGEWVNGNLVSTFPVKDVFVLLQHHDGQESNPKAQVHIQTFYAPK